MPSKKAMSSAKKTVVKKTSATKKDDLKNSKPIKTVKATKATATVKKTAVKKGPASKTAKPVTAVKPGASKRPVQKTVKKTTKTMAEKTSNKKTVASKKIKQNTAKRKSEKHQHTPPNFIKEEKQEKTNINQDAMENSGIAAFSYASFLFVVPLLLKKDSEFAQFHAKQGMIICALEVLFFWMPPIFFILILISMIGIVKSLHGETWKIPFINTWSEKIKL